MRVLSQRDRPDVCSGMGNMPDSATACARAVLPVCDL